VSQRSFGRRIKSQSPLRGPKNTEAGPQAASSELEIAAASLSSSPSLAAPNQSLDDELREWKRGRKQGDRIPWRQISLIAALCFGVASFVLPDSVNETVEWLLYVIAGAGVLGAFVRSRKTDG
jgi:hypothetical protein